MADQRCNDMSVPKRVVPRRSFVVNLSVVVITASLAGCASSGALQVRGVGQLGEDGRYHLSEDEKKLDCKKLRGRIQIRILQVRSVRKSQPPSTVAQLMQRSLTPIYGGTNYGAAPESDLKRDMAQIEALNARMGELKCPTIDIEKEIAAPG